MERPIDSLIPSNKLEEVTKRVFLDETDRIVGLNELLVLYQSTGQIRKAISILENSADRYLFLETAQRATGAILAATGQPERALPYFERAFSLEERPESARMIGSILLGQNQTEMATRYLEQSIDLGDETEQSYYNLALAYYRLNRFNQASARIDLLLQKWPANSEAQRLREAIRRR
jgi:tetratricopeptide (TPR) repeat protein